ncbi:MAG: hypothetical protein WC307_07230 [Candidatus Nanoarchaeia archaeon]|jgi:hypothetical protein
MVSDAPGAVKTLLSTYWTASNTDLKTPTCNKVYDVKELSLSVEDHILTYNSGMIPKFNGSSGNYKKSHFVTIDIRTAYDPSKDHTLASPSTTTGHQHMLKMIEEIERIIGLYRVTPGSPFEEIGPANQSQDLSDKRKGLFRTVYDVMLRETNT